jgi:hypothetical protein
MSKKVENKKINLFQVAPELNNTCNIVNKGVINYNDKLVDELIVLGGETEMNNGDKAIKFANKCFVKFYKCNITDAYLSANKKLPIMYASIMYERPFTTGYLFNILIYFEITDDLSNLSNLSELLSKSYTGKYSMDIELDENKKETIELEKFTDYKETAQQILAMIKEESMMNIITLELKKRDEDRVKRLGGMTDYSISKPTYNFNDLVDKYKRGEKLF